MERTQEEKVLSGLAHIAVLFNWVGLIGLIALYVIYKPKSSYVVGHAKQALGLWVASVLFGLVLSAVVAPIIGVGIMSGGMGSRAGMMGLGLFGAGLGLIGTAVFILVLIMVIMAAVKAFNGQEYRYPIIGDFVARIGE